MAVRILLVSQNQAVMNVDWLTPLIISLDDVNVRHSETTLTGRREEAKRQRRQSVTRNHKQQEFCEAEVKTKRDGSSRRCNYLLCQTHLVPLCSPGSSFLFHTMLFPVTEPMLIFFLLWKYLPLPSLPTSFLLILELSLLTVFSADLSC